MRNHCVIFTQKLWTDFWQVVARRESTCPQLRMTLELTGASRGLEHGLNIFIREEFCFSENHRQSTCLCCQSMRQKKQTRRICHSGGTCRILLKIKELMQEVNSQTNNIWFKESTSFERGFEWILCFLECNKWSCLCLRWDALVKNQGILCYSSELCWLHGRFQDLRYTQHGVFSKRA